MAGIFETLQQGARAHAEENGAAAGPRAIPLDIACPDCPIDVRLFQHPGDRAIKCANGHTFRDTEELQARNPRQLPAIVRKAHQPNYETIPVSIPKLVKQNLEKKYGDRLEASIGAMLAVMTQPGAFVVAEDDAHRISELLGAKVNNGQMLYGLIFSLNREKVESVDRVQSLEKARAAGQPAQVQGFSLDFPQNIKDMIYQRAANLGQTPEEYLKTNLAMAIENYWF